jgi:hypothetical protein
MKRVSVWTVSMATVVLLPIVTNLATDALPDWLAGWGSVVAALCLGLLVTWYSVRQSRGTGTETIRSVYGGAEGGGPPWNIPSPTPRFLGRATELGDLGTRMIRTPGLAVVLHGIPGVGKTQLARAYAHRTRADTEIGWWIPAHDRLSTIAALALLGRRLGIRGEDQESAAAATVDLLGRRDRWLLIFDNAVTEADLTGLIPPSGTGRVVITSRNPAFERIAEPVAVDPFAREQSARFLTERTGSRDQRAAEAIAELVGDLPLALEQAAAYCVLTGVSLAEYARRFRGARRRLLRAEAPLDRLGVEGTLRLAFRQAAGRSAAAVQLLRLLAFMAPTTAVPRSWLVSAASAVTTNVGRVG